MGFFITELILSNYQPIKVNFIIIKRVTLIVQRTQRNVVDISQLVFHALIASLSAREKSPHHGRIIEED